MVKLARSILTIFTISNATFKTPRDKQKNYFKSSVQTGLFVFAHMILSIVGVDVLGDPKECKANGTPGRSSPTLWRFESVHE